MEPIDVNEKQDAVQQDDKSGVSRRDFVAMSVAAGVVAAAGPASAAITVVEKDVVITTPDGMCDAAFIYP